MDAATQQQLLEFLVERPNRFKSLEQILHATGLLISKRTLQRFMREHHLGRFVAREHTEIRQPNRQIALDVCNISSALGNRGLDANAMVR